MHNSTVNETVLDVVDHHGREHALPALDGWRVMEVNRDWGVEVAAESDGAGLCATSPTYIDEPWGKQLDPPTDDDLSRPDRGPAVEPALRLSCQFVVSPKSHGLRLRIAAGSVSQ